jgi:hypothetical protein
MKLSIERGTLLKALAQAQSVVERRNTIPILANVLIEAEGALVAGLLLALGDGAEVVAGDVHGCPRSYPGGGVVVALCVLMDASLMAVGVAGLGAAIGQHAGWLDALALAGSAVLGWYGWQAEVDAVLASAGVASLKGLDDDALGALHTRMRSLETCIQEGLDPLDGPPAR